MHPLLLPSDLPYQLPKFADFTDDDFGPAIDEGMAAQLEAVAAITANPEPATFDNTLVPLERSGEGLSRVLRIFFNKASADTNEQIDELRATYAPKLAAHSDAIALDRDSTSDCSPCTSSGTCSTRGALPGRALRRRVHPRRSGAG